jgi:hypothetical protein
MYIHIDKRRESEIEIKKGQDQIQRQKDREIELRKQVYLDVHIDAEEYCGQQFDGNFMHISLIYVYF